MAWIEIYSGLVVLSYLIALSWNNPRWRQDLSVLALLAVASWLTENTVIHAYDFYGYSPAWSVFVDRVPLMVVLIWPVVIHSAWLLAKKLATGHLTALAAALFVLADASLIEPVAVSSDLWHWTHPGLFDVPPIGISGWAFFTFSALAILERTHGWSRLTVVLLAPLATHGLLLTTWWGFFKWMEGPIEPLPALLVVWGLSLAMTACFVRRRSWQRMRRSELLLRIPGASLFFVLLVVFAPDQWALWAWALAFVPPYMVLTPWLASETPDTA